MAIRWILALLACAIAGYFVFRPTNPVVPAVPAARETPPLPEILTPETFVQWALRDVYEADEDFLAEALAWLEPRLARLGPLENLIAPEDKPYWASWLEDEKRMLPGHTDRETACTLWWILHCRKQELDSGKRYDIFSDPSFLAFVKMVKQKVLENRPYGDSSSKESQALADRVETALLEKVRALAVDPVWPYFRKTPLVPWPEAWDDYWEFGSRTLFEAKDKTAWVDSVVRKSVFLLVGSQKDAIRKREGIPLGLFATNRPDLYRQVEVRVTALPDGNFPDENFPSPARENERESQSAGTGYIDVF